MSDLGQDTSYKVSKYLSCSEVREECNEAEKRSGEGDDENRPEKSGHYFLIIWVVGDVVFVNPINCLENDGGKNSPEAVEGDPEEVNKEDGLGSGLERAPTATPFK